MTEPASTERTIDPTVLFQLLLCTDAQRFHGFVNQALADAWHSLDEMNAFVNDKREICMWREKAQALNGVARSLGASVIVSTVSDALLLPDNELTLLAAKANEILISSLHEAQVFLQKWSSGCVPCETDHPCRSECRLTDRELEVLQWTAAGKTSSETGAILGITTRTVNFHVTRIFDKLDAVNKTQAVVKATKLHLLG